MRYVRPTRCSLARGRTPRAHHLVIHSGVAVTKTDAREREMTVRLLVSGRARVGVTCLLGAVLFLTSPPPPLLVPSHTMAEATNSSGNAGLPAMNDGSTTVTVPAIAPARSESTATLQDAVAAPSQLASTAGTAIKLSDTAWLVPQGLAFETFLYSSGPPEISRYNFNLVLRRQKPELMRRQPSQPGGGYNPSDTLVLQPLGVETRAINPTTICWREEWACSGKSANRKMPPNCYHLCGGISACLPDCTQSTEAHHNCSFRIIVTASLEDVRHNRRRVEVQGAHSYPSCLSLSLLSPSSLTLNCSVPSPSGYHVPPQTVAVPPPLDGLKPAPSLKAELARKVARGTDTPTSAVNAAAADLPSGATPNSSFVPPTKVVARLAKSLRRNERGGTLPDPVRVDLLVRSHLVQRQMVLLYEPGQMLVLSTPALLEMACGAKMVSSDAKIDTVAGVQSKWSSIRGKTPCGLSAPFAVWIGPEEN